jgi:hypothetical protein
MLGSMLVGGLAACSSSKSPSGDGGKTDGGKTEAGPR